MSLLSELFKSDESLPPATLNELTALLRENNLLLRELLRTVGGNPSAIPRPVAPAKRTPIGAEGVVVAGRSAQLRREREQEEARVAPHRSGPDSVQTVGSFGSSQATTLMSSQPDMGLMPVRQSWPKGDLR